MAFFEVAFNELNRHAFGERMGVHFFADHVDGAGHGPLLPGSVPIGGMSACRESLESVECKYAKVVSLETSENMGP
jgi:hypothetical protein